MACTVFLDSHFFRVVLRPTEMEYTGKTRCCLLQNQPFECKIQILRTFYGLFCPVQKLIGGSQVNTVQALCTETANKGGKKVKNIFKARALPDTT